MNAYIVTERELLAAHFALLYEFIAAQIGKARALLDRAVQAARRAYREVLAHG